MTGKVSPLEAEPKLGTRAVGRSIEAGSNEFCASCEEQIKYAAPRSRTNALHPAYVVVCNVYEEDRWKRVENYHQDCYENAGLPHGPILDKAPGE